MKPTRTLAWLALVATGGLLLPVAAYWAGTRIIGPYAGTRGLATFIEALYHDAAGGSPLALALLAGPVLIAILWKLRAWGLRRWLHE
ncbi:MAG: hypothetical protein IT484_08195 [Gammaproteobacteria bacterium]|nr:hypothetical protein [Gammaproteobacteria bacterium]